MGGLRGRGEGVSEAGTGGGWGVGDTEVKRVIYSQKFFLFFFFKALTQVGATAETLEGGSGGFQI